MVPDVAKKVRHCLNIYLFVHIQKNTFEKQKTGTIASCLAKAPYDSQNMK